MVNTKIFIFYVIFYSGFPNLREKSIKFFPNKFSIILNLLEDIKAECRIVISGKPSEKLGRKALGLKIVKSTTARLHHLGCMMQPGSLSYVLMNIHIIFVTSDTKMDHTHLKYDKNAPTL